MNTPAALIFDLGNVIVAHDNVRARMSVEQFNKILELRDATELPSEWKKNFALVVLERPRIK